MDTSRRILEDYYNEANLSYACPSWAPTVGFIGIASAVVFASKLEILIHSWLREGKRALDYTNVYQ